jgi:ABC-type sulfate transport system permease component
MPVVAVALAVISLPFIFRLWKGVQRDLTKPLSEAEVQLGVRPPRSIEVMAFDSMHDPNPDRAYEDARHKRYFPRDDL